MKCASVFLFILVLSLFSFSVSAAPLVTVLDPMVYTRTIAWAPGDRVLDFTAGGNRMPSIIVAYCSSDWYMHVFPGAVADSSGADTDTLSANVGLLSWNPSAGKVLRGPIRWFADDGASRTDTVWVDCYEMGR